MDGFGKAGIIAEEVEAFFSDSSKQRVMDVIKERGDGFPGPDFRQNRVAERVRELLGGLLGEVLDQAVNMPHGYNLADEASRDDFADAVVTGATLAVIDFSEGREVYFAGYIEDEQTEDASSVLGPGPVMASEQVNAQMADDDNL